MRLHWAAAVERSAQAAAAIAGWWVCTGEAEKPPAKCQSTHHADDRLKFVGREAQARDDAADGGVAASDKGVGTKVQVQHRRVGALNQDALARVVRIVDVPVISNTRMGEYNVTTTGSR